ncbi:MAG: hypothetical protein SFU57_03885 [Gemmatimonadales bacterium]|nr:hypothetical protein [Gemmatimonadales bacterium]
MDGDRDLRQRVGLLQLSEETGLPRKLSTNVGLASRLLALLLAACRSPEAGAPDRVRVESGEQGAASSPAAGVDSSSLQQLKFEIRTRLPAFGYARNVRTGAPLSADTSVVGLTDIRGVGQDSAGRLYVLDAAARRVFTYGADGRPIGAIGFGNGEGPGYFLHPLTLAVAPDGRVALADVGLMRVTVFSAMGELLWSVPSGQYGTPVGLAFSPEGVFVQFRTMGPSDSLVALIQPNGSVTRWYHVGDEHQIRLARGGQLGILSPSLDGGTATYFTPYLQKWLQLDQPRDWMGRDADPTSDVEEERSERGPPLTFVRTGLLGAGQLAADQWWTLSYQYGPGSPRAPGRVRLLYFSRLHVSGRVIQKVDLEPALPGVTRLFPSSTSNQVFALANEPEPHVMVVDLVADPR